MDAGNPSSASAGSPWECCRRRDVLSYGYDTETVNGIVADTETVS
jgi:hypothetical protein